MKLIDRIAGLCSVGCQGICYFLLGIIFLSQSATATDCPATEVDVAPLLEKAQSHKYLLIGENHGTREIPNLVASVLCQLSGPNKRILFAWEFPNNLSETVYDYFARVEKQTSNQHILDLLNNEFWAWNPHQDGRASIAMFQLIDAIGGWRAQGRHIDFVGVDIAAYGFDEHKAANLVAYRRASMGLNVLKESTVLPYDHVVFLAGSGHTSVAALQPGDGKLSKPAGAYLPREEVFSVWVTFYDGNTWNCDFVDEAVECGEMHARNDGFENLQKNMLLTEFDINRANYDALIVFERVTASKPVRDAFLELLRK